MLFVTMFGAIRIRTARRVQSFEASHLEAKTFAS
jgi:hypothetical protein